MNRFHTDQPVDIAGRTLTIVSQMGISGEIYGGMLCVTGSKIPAAIVFGGHGQETIRVLPDERIDETALQNYLENR